MTATNKLGLELLQNAAANQTLANTTFARLNQLVQAGVVDKDLAAPPASPADESLYIVGASASGAWAGRDGQLAYWLITAGAWQFITPKEGFFLHVNDEDVFYKFTGTAWEVFSGGGGGGGMTNPMTSIRDLIVGGTGGAPTRLAGPTSEGMVLTRVGNALAWAIATGFANPMTAGGDMIIGGTNGAATRLGAGTAGQVLTIVSGAPAWVTPSGGGGGSGDFKKDGSVQMTGALELANALPLSTSDSVLDLGSVDSNFIHASGSGTISYLNNLAAAAGSWRQVRFDSVMTLRQDANLIRLPGAANIVTRVGDIGFFRYLGPSPDLWECSWYARADGTALVSGAGFTEAQVRATPLTGLSTSTSGQIAAADTILAALGKLQAQLNGSAFRMETVITSTVGQTSYAVPNGYTAGQIQVWFNGVLLQPSEYTATDGANVVLQTGAISTSDVMQVGVLGSLRTQDDALLQYTVANLPSASANAFKQRWCTNMAGGAGVVVSNGTNWVRVADNTVVTV